MMQMTYEPGDGTFEIIVDEDEPVAKEWANDPATIIWRKRGQRYFLIKMTGEVGVKHETK